MLNMMTLFRQDYFHKSPANIFPLQATVLDSYDTLSYKSLFGFLWIYQNCPEARWITKTDDDVTLDLDNLKSMLEWKYGSLSAPDIMECPAVIRNMRPLKQQHSGTIMSKFFITIQELKRRVYPDVCFGWLYVTTPRLTKFYSGERMRKHRYNVTCRVGLALAEVAAKNAAELKPRSNRDDYFITGFLREKLPWVTLK